MREAVWIRSIRGVALQEQFSESYNSRGPFKEQTFHKGEVESEERQNPENHRVAVTIEATAQVISVPKSAILDRNTSSTCDLTELQHQTLANVADTLCSYDHSGFINTLIKIGHWKHDEQHVKQASQCRKADDPQNMDPHLYRTAELARRGVLNHQSHSIVCLGEARDTTKELIKYLNGESRLTQALNILEMFGNAESGDIKSKTRFGMRASLHYDGSEATCSSISTVLFDSGIVSSQRPMEGNFHCFYGLLGSTSDELVDAIKFDRFGFKHGAEGFRYTSQKTHSTEYSARFLKSLVMLRDEFDFSQKQIVGIAKVLGAILHLGNVQFNEEDPDFPMTKSGLSHFKLAASLLGVKMDDLKSALLYSHVPVAKEIQVRKMNRDRATASLHSTAEFLYTALFTFITEKLNESLQQGYSKSMHSIEILSMPDYETGKQNALAQLCINYASEKIHDLFNQVNIHSKQQLYREEGILSTNRLPRDHSSTINLFEHVNDGIFASIDEGNQVLLKADALAKSIVSFSSSNASVSMLTEKDRLSQPDLEHGFVVDHSRGFTVYDASTLVDHSTHTQAKQLLQGGGNALVQSIMESCSTTTTCTRVHQSLSSMLENLDPTTMQFILCLKPNAGAPLVETLDFDYICSLVRRFDVLPALGVIHQKYESDIEYTTLRAPYASVLGDQLLNLSDADFVKALVAVKISPVPELAFGNTRLFFKSEPSCPKSLLKPSGFGAQEITAMKSAIARLRWKRVFNYVHGGIRWLNIQRYTEATKAVRRLVGFTAILYKSFPRILRKHRRKLAEEQRERDEEERITKELEQMESMKHQLAEKMLEDETAATRMSYTLEELKATHKKKSEQLEQLQNQVEKSQNKLEAITGRNTSLQEEIEMLSENTPTDSYVPVYEVGRLKSQCEQARSARTKMNIELETVERRVYKMGLLLEEREEKVETAERHYGIQAQEVDTLTSEVRQLDRELVKAGHTRDDNKQVLGELKDHLSSLHERLHTLESETLELNTSSNLYRLDRKEVSSELSRVEKELNTNKKELDLLSNIANVLQEEIDLLEKENGDKDGLVRRLRVDKQHKIEEVKLLRAEISELSKKDLALQTNLSQARSSVRELQGQVDVLEIQRDACLKESHNLNLASNKNNSELYRLTSEMTQAMEEVKLTQEKLADSSELREMSLTELESLKIEHTETTAKLEQQYKVVTEQSDELTALKSEINNLREQFEDTDPDVEAALHAMMSKQLEYTRQTRVLREELNQLKLELYRETKKLDESSRQISAEEKQIMPLKKCIADAEFHIIDSQLQVEALRAKHNTLLSELTKLKHISEVKKYELKDKEVEYADQETKYALLGEQSIQLQRTVFELKDDLEKAQCEIHAQQYEVTSCQSLIALSKQEKEEHKQHIDELEYQVSRKKTECQEISNVIAGLRIEAMAWKATTWRNQSIEETVRDPITELEQKLADCKNELTELLDDKHRATLDREEMLTYIRELEYQQEQARGKALAVMKLNSSIADKELLDRIHEAVQNTKLCSQEIAVIRRQCKKLKIDQLGIANENETYKDEIFLYQQRVLALDIEMENMAGEQRELEKTRDTLDSTIRDLKVCLSQSLASQRVNNEKVDRLSKVTSELKDIAYVQVPAEMQDINSMLQDAILDTRAEEIECTRLEQKKGALERQYASDVLQLKDLNLELNELRHTCKLEQFEIDMLARNLVKLQEKRESVLDDVDDSEMSSDLLRKELVEYRAMFKNARARLAEVEKIPLNPGERIRLELECDECSGQIASTQTRLAYLDTQISDCEKERQAVLADLERVKVHIQEDPVPDSVAIPDEKPLVNAKDLPPLKNALSAVTDSILKISNQTVRNQLGYDEEERTRKTLEEIVAMKSNAVALLGIEVTELNDSVQDASAELKNARELLKQVREEHMRSTLDRNAAFKDEIASIKKDNRGLRMEKTLLEADSESTRQEIEAMKAKLEDVLAAMAKTERMRDEAMQKMSRASSAQVPASAGDKRMFPEEEDVEVV